jgi:DNA processing protein
MIRLLPLRPRRGWPSEQRLWWLLWASCPGLGWVRLRALERQFGSLAAAWAAPPESFAGPGGGAPVWLPQLLALRRRWGDQPLAAWSAQVGQGLGVLLPGDAAFPPLVTALERPPLALYWRGRGALWPQLARRRAVAVVGTRRPSRHGLAMAEAIGRALAQAGWPVVSGLADGIDGACHRGCLARGGRPVAVLGTPLERSYPRHHQALQHQVAQEGLLITEQPSGASVRPGHFAARNRLVVTMASAVVLVECPERSGALQAARLAWQQQLPLWVVPGDAARLSSRGSNRLLAEGATVLLDPADLLSQLGPGPLVANGLDAAADAAPARLAPTPAVASWSSATPVVSSAGADDAALLAALAGGASLEQLCLDLGSSAAALAPRLLALELAGRIQPEPGLHWRLL